MPHHPTLSTALAALLLGGSVAAAQLPQTENTLRRDPSAPKPRASIDQLSWLAGSWIGTGMGGEVEETWTAPSHGSMIGTFKISQNGEPSFYEFLLVFEHEGGLVLRLKHFNPDIVGWEEKDDFVEFPLVKVDDGAAYFSGLTYRREGDDGLIVYLAMRRGEEISEVDFHFQRP